MKREFFQAVFSSGQRLPEHIATGNPAQQERWRSMVARAKLSPEQRATVESFTRPVNLLIISGVWCGDCIEQIPLIQAIADASGGRIAVRIVDRDQHPELSSRFRLNAGARVPVVIFLSEDFEFCGVYGDRTLSRYRRLARQQIGLACPLGEAPESEDELRQTTQDWLNEIERIHWMLRLSPRLRQKHGD
ncbi:MAG: thioredoxin family protein [Phycisphaerae bacterium]|nr:thioredoxin family protein [Phycisphaerae bacterium]MDW8262178.1 thioredoxin family protein [Phycisphaerales bacterium]